MKPRQSITKKRESMTKLNNSSIDKSKSFSKPKKNKSEIQLKKSFPLPPQPENYKQINYIYDNGKMQLVDYKNNITECDIFGSQKKKFIYNITGTKTFTDRINKNLIKKLNYKNENYTPINSKFEGGFMYPRPITLPFVSLTENPYSLTDEVKKEGRIIDKKNIRIFSMKKPLKDNKSIPSFLCENLGENYPNDRKKLIKMIDDYISEEKNEHKYENDFEEKNENIRALSHFKNKLNENMTKNLYNGKKIHAPNFKDLKTNHQAIKQSLVKRILTSNKSIIKIKAHNMYANYKKVFQLKEKENKNNNNINYNFKKLFLMRQNNDNKDISSSNEMTVTNGNLKTLKTNYSTESKKNNFYDPQNNKALSLRSYINLNKNKERKLKMAVTTTTGFNLTTESFRNVSNIKKENNSVKEKIYFPKNLRVNMNTVSNFYKNKNNSILINHENENQSKKNKNYKTLEEIKKNSNHENQLLKGFVNKEIKEEKIFYHQKKTGKENASFENYKKDMELLKIVNKIAFEKEKKILKFKDDVLKKKLQGKKTLELNKI